MVYEGGDDFNMEMGNSFIICADEGFPEKKGTYCAGDFRSKDCISLLKEVDIVCTNPFSLFREYILALRNHNKHFLIIGNKNALTYKEIFPLVKNNELWLGYTSPNEFLTPEGTTNNMTGLCRWYTNLDIKKRHDGLWHVGGDFDQTIAHRYYEGFEDKYPKYDNYDAINVDKVKDIPIDFPGIMGVPITWLDKYNPDEFEIIKFRKGNDGKDLCINGKCPYFRILIKNKNPIKKGDDKGY